MKNLNLFSNNNFHFNTGSDTGGDKLFKWLVGILITILLSLFSIGMYILNNLCL